MVHDAMGVSGHSIEQVLSLGEGAPVLLWSSFDALSAHEEVSELGDAALDILCTAVGKGAVAGIVCSHRPAAGLCPSLWGRVLCVDVAPDAVTLMRRAAADADRPMRIFTTYTAMLALRSILGEMTDVEEVMS